MTKQLWTKIKEVIPSNDVPNPKVAGGRQGAHYVESENRVCSMCGDTNFLSGVLAFERSFVTGVLCRTCLNKI